MPGGAQCSEGIIHMPVFALQPASMSTPDVARHFADTVENPVEFGQHDDVLPSDVSAQLRLLFPSGLAQLWGVVPGPTNSGRAARLHAGDGVAFYGARRLYAAGRIAVRFDSEELAERLWGKDKSDRTWAHMYAFTDFHSVDVDISEVAKIMGWSDTAVVQGFTVAEEDKAERLAELCGVDLGTPLLDPALEPVPRPDRDHTQWQPDNPSDRDDLNRAALAKVLATRLDGAIGERPADSFLLHIDGSWGSGKSTLLRLLKKEVESNFLVLEFNAWRNGHVDPPWWSLLASLRRAAAEASRHPRYFGIKDAYARLKRSGQLSNTAAAALFGLVAIAVLAIAVSPTKMVVSGVKNAAAIGSAIALAGVAWRAVVAGNRFFRWDSAHGARRLADLDSRPMDQVAEYFAWLVRKCPKPVLFFIDDLDRCEPTYVVELLQAVQTLVREWENGVVGAKAPCFAVTADGAWLRQAYEIHFSAMKPAMDQPGRPIGYLFLDKIFQLSVPMPAIGAAGRTLFLRRLLNLDQGPSNAQIEAEAIRVLEEVSNSANEAQVLTSLRSASPRVREIVAAEAVTKMSEAKLANDTEHALEKFAPLLDANPRSMKRYVNAYSVARAIRTLEGNVIETDTLARWVIVQTRWPQLADYLQAHPSAIDCFIKPELVEDEAHGLPEDIKQFVVSSDVARVLGAETLMMSEDDIRACCGENALSMATDEE